MRKVLCAVAAACVIVPGAASASQMIDPGNTQARSAGGQRIVTGSGHGLNWTAQSLIVGQTSTGRVPPDGNGDPIYLAFDKPFLYSGTVGLLMRYENGSGFVCSGSLLTSGRIVTAAHCVSDGFASNINGRAPGLATTTAFFYDTTQLAQGFDPRVYPTMGVNPAGVVQIPIANYAVNPRYTGEVIDQNDIAVLTLGGSGAPSWAQRYELYTPEDESLQGEEFNVAGYGARSNSGGEFGTIAGPLPDGLPNPLATGFLRQGDNVYDYRWGDPAFNGFFTEVIGGENFFGTAEIDFSYVSDFDRVGFPANNASCLISAAVGAGTPAEFCGLGVGPLEVGIAGGDSGGPNFINGRLAGVNSYGLSFGTNFGDFRPGLNVTWGEFSGYVPTFIHNDFITSVPEPSTWAMMLLGFGSIGTIIRRRERKTRAALAC